MEPTDSARPLGPYAAAILATEHWSLLGTRALIWNEAMSRATVFMTVLSASIVALALLANATGFGPRTITLALVLLPVVLLLGIATYGRLVQINNEEFKLVRSPEPAMAAGAFRDQHADHRGDRGRGLGGLPLRCWSCRQLGRRQPRWWLEGCWGSWRSGEV